MIWIEMRTELWEEVLFALQKVEEPSVAIRILIDELVDAIVDNEAEDAGKQL